MSNWPETKFGDLYEIPSKNGLTAPSRVRGKGTRLVNMREIFAFDIINDQQMERAPLPQAESGSWLLREGDLLFARQSLTLAGAGKVSLVGRHRQPLTFESHIIRVRLSATADPHFYYYLFKSSPGRDLMGSIVSQVAAAGIRASDLSRLLVPAPPLDEQRQVAAMLGALDDLIDHDAWLISVLRDIASAAFADGCIEGDAVGLAEVAELSRESVSPEDLAQGVPYVGLEHFAGDGAGLTSVGDSTSVNSLKSRFRAGDVLYGKLRPYFRKFDRPGFDGVCSTEIWVMRPKEPWGAATLHAIVARPEFSEFAVAGSGGTRMPRASWDHVAGMRVAVPGPTRRGQTDAVLEDLWRASVQLHEEIAELTAFRDELLPLLMSGRVRVRDLEGVG